MNSFEELNVKKDYEEFMLRQLKSIDLSSDNGLELIAYLMANSMTPVDWFFALKNQADEAEENDYIVILDDYSRETVENVSYLSAMPSENMFETMSKFIAFYSKSGRILASFQKEKVIGIVTKSIPQTMPI